MKDVVMIPRKLFEDKRLTPPERDLLALLYYHFPPDETMTLRFKVPIRKLCEIAGREKRAVSYLLASLKDKGWIRANEGEDQWEANRYFVGPPTEPQTAVERHLCKVNTMEG